MIIFDLDGTLADCEHRRHFVDRNQQICVLWNEKNHDKNQCIQCQTKLKYWKPDWQAFHEACDKDEYIIPTFEILRHLRKSNEIQIWSARCESQKNKTFQWLHQYQQYLGWVDKIELKMRPIGDSTPDDILKEKWLDDAIADGRKPIMVFDDRPKVIRMWRRRGIFVFNCCQHDEEF